MYLKLLAAWLLLPAWCLHAAGALMNLAPFGMRVDRRGEAGIEWRDVRDVHEVRVSFSGALPADLQLQYWAHTWPGPAPRASRIEDPADDPWQGEWLTAAA